MKIAIYSPYLDTAGGGEKYVLTIAEYLSKNHQVDFLLGTHLYNLNVNGTVDRIQKLHNLDLSKVNFTKAPIGVGSSGVKRLKFLKKYDYLFYLGDGSIFYSSAKNNILHIQSPIKNSGGIKNKIKLSTWKFIIYNSEFTKNLVEKSWGRPGKVVYPPVAIQDIKPLKKKKQIISVGRFYGYLRDKKHEFLINSFKKLDETDWSLHLIGGAGEGDEPYVEELKKSAKGSNIFIHPNLPFEDLKKMYGESSIYWHAMGYGEDDPTKMEHFGITTVEAMAGGVVPVAIGKGGQVEIVENEKSGYLWNSEDELIELTRDLINNKTKLNKLSKEAIKRSKLFSKEKFCENIGEIVR
jgi:glycosyltransferase involved in cell wall biosynthesis